MSLIHTAELADADVFDYLVALQRHHEQVEREPDRWMPWNYRDMLPNLAQPTARADPGTAPP